MVDLTCTFMLFMICIVLVHNLEKGTLQKVFLSLLVLWAEFWELFHLGGWGQEETIGLLNLE